MLLFVFSATVFRYFELGSLTWADEASRYLMIWLAFAGIGLGFKKNAHLGISFFINRLPRLGQKVFYYIRAIIIILFGGLVTHFTFLLIMSQINNGQLSPALGIPMWLVYLAVLFGSVMMIIRTLQLVIISTRVDDYKDNQREEEVI